MATNVFDYIKSQGELFIDKLYGSESNDARPCWACKAIYQSLSSLAKTYITRLIFIDNHQFTPDDLLGWLSSGLEHLNQVVINELSSLKIIKRKGSFYIINPYFREFFMLALCDPKVPWQHSDDAIVIENEPTIGTIEKYCSDKWNAILRYLVTSKLSSDVHNTIQSYFKEAGYLAIGEDEARTKRLMITAKGYEYILKDQQAQVIDSFNLFQISVI